MASQKPIIYSNGGLAELTSADSLGLPASALAGQPIVQGQEIPLKSIAYASLPTTGLPSTAIAWCPDFQYGTPPTSWAGPVAWNGTAWVPLYAGALPAATVAGQPLNFSQLGGAAAIEQATIPLPSQVQTYEYTVARIGTLPTQQVKAWFSPTLSSDDNDLWQLETCLINAQCDTDSVSFFFSSNYNESGNIKVSYQVL